MALDGSFTASDSRMLTNREAALLNGQWWECADDGSEVWQRLSIKPSPASIVRHASEALAITRAVRQLKRRRVELLMELERLRVRLDSVSAMPMARLFARKDLAALQEQIAQQRKALADLPAQPVVHRLDPDASCGVLADATTKEIAQEIVAEQEDAAPPPVDPIVHAPPPHPDSIEALATRPFDESLLG